MQRIQVASCALCLSAHEAGNLLVRDAVVQRPLQVLAEVQSTYEQSKLHFLNAHTRTASAASASLHPIRSSYRRNSLPRIATMTWDLDSEMHPTSHCLVRCTRCFQVQHGKRIRSFKRTMSRQVPSESRLDQHLKAPCFIFCGTSLGCCTAHTPPSPLGCFEA